MLGAIIGDIVGSRFEFKNHRSTNFEFFCPLCTFTDDTVMTVAVADAILSGRPFGEVMHEYGRRHANRGYGGRFRQWLHSDHPEPYDSYGNGSAMRVSPCALLARKMTEKDAAASCRERALTLAASSAVCTHNHPEGIKGALSVTDVILMAFDHEDKSLIKKKIERLYGYDLNFSIAGLRPHYHFDATCQGSVPQAIVAFLESHDFESAIRLAVSLGGDSDTIANITGGMAEAYYGIPEEMKATALSLLPSEMADIVRKMYE